MFNLWELAQRSRAIRTNPAYGYPLAFAFVCLAVVAKLFGGWVLNGFPFLTFYPAVVVAAFFCGPGPAAMAAVLGAGLSTWFLFDPATTLRFQGVGLWIAMAFYVCTTALIIALMDGILTALEKLHATAHRLQLAMDAGGMAVWEFDLGRQEVIATPELNRLLGFPPTADVSVAQITALTPPQDWEKLRETAREAIHSGQRYFELEMQVRRSDESLRWYSLSAEILRARNGVVPKKIVGVLSDVTERKEIAQGLEQAVVQLREREKELNTVLDASGMAPFDYDLVTETFRPSPRLNRLYGYSVHHFLDIEDLRARYYPEDGYLQEAARRAADPRQHSFESDFRLKMPDGKAKWVVARGEYVRDSSGKALRSRGLVMDITARKDLEQTRELLLQELEHRIKNTLTTVNAITAQTLRGDITLEQARAALQGRFAALAGGHELVTRHHWRDMDIRQVVEKALQPLHVPGHIEMEGPDCPLSPKRALALTLALHELATNAMKYGALSRPEGRVTVRWSADKEDREGERLHFDWRESGGPAVTAPQRRGFGSQIIERVLAMEFAGTVTLDYGTDGLSCTLTAPLHGAH